MIKTNKDGTYSVVSGGKTVADNCPTLGSAEVTDKSYIAEREFKQSKK